MNPHGKPYQEYFLVATGNQSMVKSGQLKGTGASLNIASGQLGMISAVAGNSVKDFGYFLTGSETALTVPVVQFVQGTPAASDNSAAYGWPSQDNGVVRSCKVRASEVMACFARHYQIPTYSSKLLSVTANPTDDTSYSIFVTQRSNRLSRSYRQQKVSSSIFDTGTITATVSKDWMLQNLLYKVNQQSKKVVGNDSFVALALNLGGSANGTAIGAVGLGDTIPFMVYNGVTYNLVADRALIQTIYRWITDNSAITAATTIEPIDLSTAGSKVAATGTFTVTDYTALATDTVTIDGTALVEGTDWNAGASNTAAATALAAAIDAVSGVSATSSGAVVSVVWDTAGAAGNAIVWTYTDGGTAGGTISGSGTLTGGDDTNVDGVMIMGLAQSEAESYDGLPNDMVDVSQSEFGHGFQDDVTLTVAVACGSREPLQSGRFLTKYYDERAFAQSGLTSLNGKSDTLLQAAKYIDPAVNYTMISIVGKATDKNHDHNYRVNILVPGTDDGASATGATGIAVTTNASNTETDLNSVLDAWIDAVVGIEYLGQAVSGTPCPA